MTTTPVGRIGAVPARPIAVWDLPTRIFHWGLVAMVTISWLTGEGESTALTHRLVGEGIAGLILFRVVWGFVGGEHARFAHFLKGPRAVADHLAHLVRGRAAPSLGHNPLGGLSVLLLLASVSLVVVTGLFSAGDEGSGGPFAGRFGLDLTGLHEPAFRILQGLVVLHLAGVAVTSIASRENLVRAMITGDKRRAPDDGPAAPARKPSVAALLLAVAVGTAGSAVLMSLPHPLAGGETAGAQHRDAAHERGSPEEAPE